MKLPSILGNRGARDKPKDSCMKEILCGCRNRRQVCSDVSRNARFICILHDEQLNTHYVS